jgi:CheY-like chemotaxis protein
MAVVLVVDDELAIVELIASLVADHGHTPLRAFNGNQALALASKRRPALIISDVMMPFMDGYALLRALRSDPDLAHAAVYLMSAASFGPLPPTEVSPDGFLHKPFDLATIAGLLAGLTPRQKAFGE